jgi:mycothione reductase
MRPIREPILYEVCVTLTIEWRDFGLKEYDLIAIGTGSAMNIVEAMVRQNPQLKVAVIDKDEPGGICLTRGCIPSKILLYPAELVRAVERASNFGIVIDVKNIDFRKIMERMRNLIRPNIDAIRDGLSHSKNIDYFPAVAEFVAPYILKVGSEVIRSEMILLCTGSKPIVPAIKGLEEVGYLTSDTFLEMNRLPECVIVIGGGYIAAEYGHFLSAMGSAVTIIGRNPRFLPEEEPEVSLVARWNLQKHMTIITNHEVVEAGATSVGKKKVVAVNRENGERMEVVADEILVAAGRGPNTDVLYPGKGGVRTDDNGWIVVNEYLETSQKNVWAFGDAKGTYPFKHVANYESLIVYYNAVLKTQSKVDYHAVPHAVFTYPEIGGVGFKEKEAIERYGEENVLIGIQRYQDVTKGEAMGVRDFFTKVIVDKNTMRILGAHIIGPNASVLIQEIVTLMYTPEQSPQPILDGMHIHPALSEVVERAFRSLMSVEQYHHLIEHHYELSVK